LNAARGAQNRLWGSKLDEKGNDDGCKIDVATVGHIQLVTSLVEGRWIGFTEIFAMLDKILRQHSIDSAVKLLYAATYRQKSPP